MNETVRARFIEFLERPDQASYRELFHAVTSSDEYDPYARDLVELGEMLESGEGTARAGAVGGVDAEVGHGAGYGLAALGRAWMGGCVMTEASPREPNVLTGE